MSFSIHDSENIKTSANHFLLVEVYQNESGEWIEVNDCEIRVLGKKRRKSIEYPSEGSGIFIISHRPNIDELEIIINGQYYMGCLSRQVMKSNRMVHVKIYLDNQFTNEASCFILRGNYSFDVLPEYYQHYIDNKNSNTLVIQFPFLCIKEGENELILCGDERFREYIFK